ncbi:hypothetical protein TUMEXPCC7403_23055 [Tumidithrix helvetica PCC 7403]|uniref:hypothetical protein n=1 Tax=Tumidithrix helvetica TaxID=3457545 RepID=UPI003CB7B2CD
MSKPVNVIKIAKVQTKSKIKSYRILIDKKDLQVHLAESLSAVSGSRKTWSDQNHIVFDGLELLESGKKSGHYTILNCTCGSGAECAGVPGKIEVIHEGNLVRWVCGVPEVWIDGESQFFTFVFHKPQLLKELKNVDPTANLSGLSGYGVRG